MTLPDKLESGGAFTGNIGNMDLSLHEPYAMGFFFGDKVTQSEFLHVASRRTVHFKQGIYRGGCALEVVTCCFKGNFKLGFVWTKRGASEALWQPACTCMF
jgi:hypothetical protein